ncbi:Embryonic protein DC-8, putative [Ixodes scapularis]|uniref:Embryonic protein DC-8, putative n=1 Tax=Ixodes scapularis TaxID=6945 RepID=B7PT52_IXOSC|nr:Embryonic protein DC-8, putative [Ixodes scapularis]|eukprot:XP_002403897.1 Embryonic protein DC-8, putative [Ixodes scapularis]
MHRICFRENRKTSGILTAIIIFYPTIILFCLSEEAGQEPPHAREECKPDVARVGPEKPPPDSRPAEPIPGRTSHEPGTPVDQDVAKRPGDGAPDAPPRSALTKKPSKLESAKEDVLGVFESVKKNVGAAKEAFFDKPGKTDQPKPASPKSTEPKTPDVPEVKKAEDEKGKTESFLQKLRFGKSEDQKSKEKSSPEAVSSPAETEKQPSGSPVPQFGQNVSALAETPGLLKEKAQGTLDAGKTNVELMSKQAHDATVSLKQTSQAVFDAGRVEAESLKQKSQHVLDVGKAEADALKQKSQEAVDAGKVQAESLKQKPQEVVDATKAQVESLKQTTEQSLESIKQQVLDAGQAQAECLKHKSVEAFDAATDGAKQASQEVVDIGKSDVAFLNQKSVDAASVLREMSKDAAATTGKTADSLTDKAKETYDIGKQKVDTFLQQVKPAVVGASDTVKQRSQDAFDTGKAMADSYAQQIKAFMFDESDAAKKSPPDVSADEKGARALGAEEEPAGTLLDQVKFAALSSQAALELAYRDPLGRENKDEAPKGASRTEVLGSPEAAAFQAGKEKSFDGFGKQPSECLQTDSQEMFDSAKSQAELLVDHVISSVVGASESLKHASEDAFGSDKEKIEFLKERAQQEFESGKSKTNTEHANQQVSSATRLEFEGAGGEQPKPSELLLLHVEQGDRRSLSPKLEDIETAVVKIQAGVRGYLTRKNLHERSPQPQHDDSEYQTADADQSEASGESDPSSTAAAATKIQAAFRGYRVRKELKPDNGPSGLHKEERELVESR